MVGWPDWSVIEYIESQNRLQNTKEDTLTLTTEQWSHHIVQTIENPTLFEENNPEKPDTAEMWWDIITVPIDWKEFWLSIDTTWAIHIYHWWQQYKLHYWRPTLKGPDRLVRKKLPSDDLKDIFKNWRTIDKIQAITYAQWAFTLTFLSDSSSITFPESVLAPLFDERLFDTSGETVDWVKHKTINDTVRTITTVDFKNMPIESIAPIVADFFPQGAEEQSNQEYIESLEKKLRWIDEVILHYIKQ